MLAKLFNYLRETKVELGRVKWPTKRQAVNYTLLVIGFSLAVAIFLGFFDTVFGWVLKKFIL